MPHTPDLDGVIEAPEEGPSIAPRLPVGDVFFGRDGLRAGWSLLLYLILVATLVLAAGSLLSHAPNSDSGASPTVISPRSVLISEDVPLLCVAIATWIMAKIEHRPVPTFGLGGRRRLPNFVAGLAWGLALLSLLVLSLRATSLLVFDARLLFGRSALRYGERWLTGFLVVGLFEEYFFRGYLQYTLARGLAGIYGLFRAPRLRSSSIPLGFWTAAVLISFGFGFTHKSNPGESPIGLLSAGLIGLVFCLSLWRTGSLWWAIGFHAAWDWAQSFLYGVGDSGLIVQGRLFSTHPVGRPILSGGITGPEGSLFILPVLAVAAIITLLTLPNLHKHPEPSLKLL